MDDFATINERVSINYGDVSEDIEYVLDEIHTMRADNHFLQAFGISGVQKLKEWEFSIRKRLQEAFQIVFIGDMKRGKSTLINAILGKAIVPTSVTPETVTINKISYSETIGADAILKNGKKVKLSFDELKRVEIEKLLEQIPAGIEYIDIKENSDILKEVCVIDTPGVGDIVKEFDDQVKDYLINADAVIYIVSAKSPMSLTEQSFLSASVLPQDFSRVFVVVNMADCLENIADIEKIKQLTIERVHNIIPSASVYAISALDEYCRKLSLPRPRPELGDYLENNFDIFHTALKNDILLQKDIIKTMRGLALSKLMLADMSARTDLMTLMLSSNIEKLSLLEEQYKNENSELLNHIEQRKGQLCIEIDELKFEAKNWMTEFLSKIKAEVQGIKADADVGILQKYFQFYMMDKVKEAILICTAEHQKVISNKLQMAAKSFATELHRDMFANVNAQIADCITDISWTRVDSTMFAVSIGADLAAQNGLGLGGIMLLGQAIAGYFRKKELDKKQSDFLNPVLQEFGTITENILAQIEIIYEKIKKKSIEQLDAIYQAQIELSLNAIKQAQEISHNEDLKSDEILAFLSSITVSISDLKDRLNKYD